MKLIQACNNYLDKVVRSGFLHGQRVPAYGLFVFSGIAAGFASVIVLAILFKLSFPPLLIAVCSGLLATLTLAYATKILTGNEIYSFYHYQLAVMIAEAVVLWCLKQPVLINLDVLILSMGVTHAFGRVGCLVAGCCFGCPRDWGVSYSRKHGIDGFPHYLVGVRLLPIQLIESIWIMLSVAAGVFVTLRGAHPGSGLIWYTVIYGSGRFVFEFQRMDTARWFGTLTEAQVTSLVLTSTVAVCELAGRLPLHPFHVGAALLLLILGLYRSIGRSEAFLSGPHILELAAAMRAASPSSNSAIGNASKLSVESVAVKRTSLGLLISAGRYEDARGRLLHFSISRGGKALTDGTARRVARLLARLHGCEVVRVVRSSNVFHALIFIGEGQNRECD